MPKSTAVDRRPGALRRKVKSTASVPESAHPPTWIKPQLTRLAGVLKPLETPRMPLYKPPPRENRFGSPLELSRVHWVRPEVVVEVTYLTWTEGGLLRAVSYQGQREDKPGRQVVRSIPHGRL